MKKLLFAIPFMLVLLALAITPALAAPLAWQKEGGATCSLVYAKIKNEGNTRFYSSYIKANGDYVVGPDWGTVAPNQWVQVSWTPPANFVGSVEASVVIWHLGSWGRTVVDDSKVVTGDLDCVQHTPVTLCHAKPADTAANGWNDITVDDDAVVKKGHAYQHNADIIPAFTYYDKDGQHNFPGKNLTTLFGWGATGQQVLDNGCVLPPPPPYVPCSERVAQTPITTYGEWSAWVYNAQTGKDERTRTKTVTVNYVDSQDGRVCPPPDVTVTTEKEQRNACAETVDGTPGAWSDWELVNGVWTSTRSVPLFDSLVPTHSCGSRTETRTQEFCEETVAVNLPDTYSGWSPWVYDPKDGLEHSFRTVTHHSYLGDAIDPEHVCTPPADPEIQERTREVDYALSVTGTADCDMFEYLINATEGAEISVEGELSGSWKDLYGPESAPAPEVTATWPSGYSLTVRGSPETINKPDTCIQCKREIAYPQAAYIDVNAPSNYWQGPFGMGPGICPVIHPEGETPSANRVIVLCSLCENQYTDPITGEAGFIYNSFREFYDGYVWKVTCRGVVHYEYMGLNWDQWYKSGYEQDGTRTCAREEGCADWIKEKAGITEW